MARAAPTPRSRARLGPCVAGLLAVLPFVACTGGVRGPAARALAEAGAAGAAAPVVVERVGVVPAPDDHDRSPRRGLAGLPDAARVDDGLWRSAQPTAEGYATAKALGIRTVVDLRGSRTDAALVRAAGLDYVAVRCGAKSLDADDVHAFLRVATDVARRPVLVHCASGHDRTGAMVAAYRRVVNGWDAEAALREMRRFGAAPWYDGLRDVVRRLDPAAVRAVLDAPAPGPAVPAGD